MPFLTDSPIRMTAGVGATSAGLSLPTGAQATSRGTPDIAEELITFYDALRRAEEESLHDSTTSSSEAETSSDESASDDTGSESSEEVSSIECSENEDEASLAPDDGEDERLGYDETVASEVSTSRHARLITPTCEMEALLMSVEMAEDILLDESVRLNDNIDWDAYHGAAEDEGSISDGPPSEYGFLRDLGEVEQSHSEESQSEAIEITQDFVESSDRNVEDVARFEDVHASDRAMVICGLPNAIATAQPSPTRLHEMRATVAQAHVNLRQPFEHGGRQSRRPRMNRYRSAFDLNPGIFRVASTSVSRSRPRIIPPASELSRKQWRNWKRKCRRLSSSGDQGSSGIQSERDISE